MNTSQNEVSRSLSSVQVVNRKDIRAIASVEIDGQVHQLGEHRDFRRHAAFRNFLPEQGRPSFSWVRLTDGEVLENHQHPVSSMIIVCRGSVYLTGDMSRLVFEGDTVCIPAGKKHGFRTEKGQEFHGLSIQFDGAGLYEDERAPRVHFIPTGNSSYHELVKLNDQLLARHGRNALFRLMASGALQRDDAQRTRFLEALYVWSRYFQKMIHARQAFCTDQTLLPLYADHLGEELGHDEMLRAEHDLQGTAYDPVLEAASQWFVSKMWHGDEAEKVVVVHMVIESSGHLFGEASRRIFRGPDANDDTYFDVHAVADDDHRTIGQAYLQSLSAAQYPALMETCRKAWDQMDLIHERIAAIAAGTQRVAHESARAGGSQ